MKAQYREHCQLLYTDTDSLLLEIQTEDVYKDIGNRADHYDLSDNPPEHPRHSMEILGKMKDECAGHPTAEYVGLRPKMYSIKDHQEGQGCQKDHREEAHQAWAVYRGPFRKADLSPWHGYRAVRAPPHLWAATEQGITLTRRLQALDRWNGADALAYGHKDAIPAGWALQSYALGRTPSGGSCVSGGTPLRLILQVVQHRLARLGHRAPKPVNRQRPYWISRRATTGFQLVWLEQIANANTWRELFARECHQDGLEQWRGIMPWWSQKAVCQWAESLLRLRPQRPRVSEPPTQMTAH